ncbi:unnamed protein product, partial [Durusdinium trenchii]
DRAKEVVGFAYDERTRMRKELNYADVYHSANRYGSGKEQVPIVLPRSQLYSFLRGRLVLGRESLRLQGHGWDPRHLMLYSESNLQDLAGNSFSANVIMAVIAAVLCSLRFVSESEAEENDDISEMVRQMQEPFQNMES